MKPGHVPLERALSKLGIASRTQARAWILAGKVSVNGAIRTNPLALVWPERVRIQVASESRETPKRRIFLLNKPRGVITTHSDEKGRPTVFSLIKEYTEDALHLIAVGRLDFATTGLLLFTNDTRLAAWLTDPSNQVQRVYVVTVRGEVTENTLIQLRSGIVDRGVELNPETVTLRKSSGKESHLVVHLAEGKNREIRRIFLAVGHEVTRLKRVAYGGLALGDLQPGTYRELAWAEAHAAFPGAPIELPPVFQGKL